MREIKFRGKESDDDWIVGSLIHDELLNKYHIANRNRTRIIPDHETIGQFTGLKDSKGREIYEGDIIETLDSQSRPCRHIVGYSDERGGYVQYLFLAEGISVDPFDCGLLWQQYILDQGKYIIGNIHDNPDLLSK